MFANTSFWPLLFFGIGYFIQPQTAPTSVSKCTRVNFFPYEWVCTNTRKDALGPAALRLIENHPKRHVNETL